MNEIFRDVGTSVFSYESIPFSPIRERAAFVRNAKGETLLVEFQTTIGTNEKNDLPRLWYKYGKTPVILRRYFSVSMYVFTPDGKEHSGDDYNPAIISGTTRINFDWLLAATAGNKQKLLNEISRRFYGEVV